MPPGVQEQRAAAGPPPRQPHPPSPLAAWAAIRLARASQAQLATESADTAREWLRQSASAPRRRPARAPAPVPIPTPWAGGGRPLDSTADALALSRAHILDIEDLVLSLEEAADQVVGVARTHPEPGVSAPLEGAVDLLRMVWSALRALAAIFSATRVEAVAKHEKLLTEVMDSLGSTITWLTRTNRETAETMSRQLDALAELEASDDPTRLAEQIRSVASAVHTAASGMRDGLARSSARLSREGQGVRDSRRQVATAREQSIRAALPRMVSRADLDERLESLMLQAERFRVSWCVAVMEVDQLRAIEKRLGPAGADALFIRLAEIVQSRCEVHTGCALGHYAEHQLGLVASPCSLGRGRQIAEDIRAAVADAQWECRASTGTTRVAATLSIGLTQPRLGASVEQLRQRVEAQLAQARARGGNCVAAAR